jgi:hypothetical protein
MEVLDNPDDDPNYSVKKQLNPYVTGTGNISSPNDNPTYHVPWTSGTMFTVRPSGFKQDKDDKTNSKYAHQDPAVCK